MNAKEKFVPQRRFKKFKNGDDWEQRKLCNIVTNISDGDWIESEHIFNDGEYRIIQTGNLGEGIYLDKINSAKFFYQKDFIQLNANEIFPGDILISRLAEPAGRTIILPNTGKRMVTSVDVTVIRPDDQNFDSMFLMTQMNSSKVLNEVNKSVAGTTHKRISRKNLEQIDLYVPHLAEQTVLGAFFKQIDNIIALQMNKLDKSKELKSAYLSEMFPAEGELKPKRRFAGFKDDWEQRKLVDVVKNIGTGNSKFQIQEKSNDASYAILGSTSVIGYDNNFDYEGNFVLTARVGANAGTLYQHSGKVKISDNTVYIQSDNLSFLYNLLNRFDLKKLSFGTGQPLVKSSELKKLALNFPNKEEQEKIGNFFNQLDNTIALHQHKLEKLQSIKQAYLNEMFV